MAVMKIVNHEDKTEKKKRAHHDNKETQIKILHHEDKTVKKDNT